MKTKDLLNKLFDESKKKKSLLSIYDNKNEIDKFYVGYITEMFEDSILLYSYNENGEEDGYLLIRLVDIFKIEKESVYLNSLSSLIEQDESTNRKAKKFKREGKEGIAEIASICREEKILVTIRLIYDDFITGYIIEEDDAYFLIEAYSKNGMQDGYILIEYNDIQNLHFEGKEERNLNKLLSYRLEHLNPSAPTG